jgi:hypothetical protein
VQTSSHIKAGGNFGTVLFTFGLAHFWSVQIREDLDIFLRSSRFYSSFCCYGQGRIVFLLYVLLAERLQGLCVATFFFFLALWRLGYCVYAYVCGFRPFCVLIEYVPPGVRCAGLLLWTDLLM